MPTATRIGENDLIAAAPAGKTGETSMKVSTFKIFAHHLPHDLAPGAVLLLVAVVVDALELLVMVLPHPVILIFAHLGRFDPKQQAKTRTKKIRNQC